MPPDIYNRLAGELPEDFVVVLRVERGAAWVELELPGPPDRVEDIRLDDSTMDEILLAALARAKELACSAVPPGVVTDEGSRHG